MNYTKCNEVDASLGSCELRRNLTETSLKREGNCQGRLLSLGPRVHTQESHLDVKDPSLFDQFIDQQIDKYNLNRTIYILVIAITVIVIIIILSEIAAYLWHRVMSHEDIISPVRQTHLNHHQADWLHEAHSDFIWILIGLIIIVIVLIISYYLNLAPIWLLILAATGSIFMATWNWYIHMAYHQP